MQCIGRMTLQIQDLPLESCVAVGCNTSVARAAELATRAGARYVMVREATGDVRGVQLTSVASYMASQSPLVTADELPVVPGVQVEPGMAVLDALTMLAHSTAPIVFVRGTELEGCQVVQRNLLEMTAGVAAYGGLRPELLS